jgi:hypothetical protein
VRVAGGNTGCPWRWRSDSWIWKEVKITLPKVQRKGSYVWASGVLVDETAAAERSYKVSRRYFKRISKEETGQFA